MPLLPASIGIIFNNDNSKVLLVKRRDIPIWVLPGGGIEAEESPEQALIREIYEETGYHVQICRKCAEYEPINTLASFTTVFICRIVSGTSTLSDETSEIAFHSILNIQKDIFPPHILWIKEAITHADLIRRPLKEISYGQIIKYFLMHPWQVFRYAWTRFIKKS